MSAKSKKHYDRLNEMKDSNQREQYLHLWQGYRVADEKHKSYQNYMENWLDNIYKDYLSNIQKEEVEK